MATVNGPHAGDLCRLTVVVGGGRADLAVPVDLPIAELLPVLVRSARLDVSTGDWVLQRLGEEPLDEDATPQQLGLHDGDTLYLRTARTAMPPIDFDDIVDGIASAVGARTDVWKPGYTGVFLLASTVLAALAALAVLIPAGQLGLRVAVAGGLSLLLVSAAAASSRALDDLRSAVTLGLAAVGFAAFAGTGLPAALGAGRDSYTTADAVLSGGAFAAGMAMLAMATTGVAAALFTVTAVVTAAAGAGALLISWPGLPPAGAAAIVAGATYLLSVLAPNVVARIAKLRPPELPTSAADLSRDIDAFPEQQIVARANAADRYLTAVAGAVAAICLGAFVVLIRSATPLALVTVAVIAFGLALRARTVIAFWQRLALAVPAAAGLALLAVGATLQLPPAGRALAAGGLVLVAVLLTWMTRRLGRAQVSPYLGRVADVFETLTAVAVVPLAVGLAGGYTFAQGLAG